MYPLIDPTYTPDAAASIVDDVVTEDDLIVPFLKTFPYLGVPHSGFNAGMQVTHSHIHPHAHPHRHEQPLVPARGAVLDIGGDVGALLVQAGAELEGAEIELYRPDGTYLMHTEVHGRDVGGTRTYAGLFPAVVEGSYLLDLGDGSDAQRPSSSRADR